MQDGGGRHLEKITKMRYHSNGLIDIHEICHDHEKWVSSPSTPLKIFEFPKSKMADGRHFENR